MPSLQALEEFKSSFSRIGDEQETLADLGLPHDDFPLPGEDADAFDLPDPPEFLEDAGGGGDPGAEDDIFGDFGDLLGGAHPALADDAVSEDPFPAGQEDVDFGEFIDTIPDDFAPPDPAESDPGDFSLDDFAADFAAEEPAASNDFDAVPEDDSSGADFGAAALLDGLADELEAEQASPAEGDPAFDLAFGEEEDAEGVEVGDSGFGDMDLGGLPEFDVDESPDLSAEAAMDIPDDEDSFEMGTEAADFDSSAVLEEISGDSFDSFKLDTGSFAETPAMAGEEAGSFGDDFGSLDDFSLAGVDSVFDGASAPTDVSPIAGGAGAKASGKKADVDDVEEIRLTNQELEQLQATLASYPLNLRIACQELIAEQAVDPAKMSRLVKLLTSGAPAKETAALAGKILDRPIPIPKGFEKKTGEALEAEQSSFGYIFVHNFLPVFRLFIIIALVGLCALYLSWRFIYSPIRADRIYRQGIELIAAGQFSLANNRFHEAFRIHQRASWFFEYARAFTEARQFTLAEEKYLELLNFTASRNRRGIPDKAAVLEYAHMVSVILGHHERADTILRHNLLDFFPVDRDGLLALGDNAMLWGEHDPSRFEDAREAYARIIEIHGRSDLMLERMLMFFIRTDNLGEVLALQSHFMASERRRISAEALAEMGGYFLDKRLEEVRGVPNEFLEHIGGIRQILLRAIRQNPMLPEAYYHLARYYNYFNNLHDERLTLEVGLRVFQAAAEESPRRIRYHINALRRYGEILIRNREFFPAAEYLERGIRLYESALSRRLLAPAPEFGKLYASMGDLELFTRLQEGHIQAALDYYRLAEQNGWAPPEIQFRMGAAYYHLGEWAPALDRFLAAHREVPLNRRILYALGNAAFLRGNYFAAQGFYDQLLGILHADRSRLPEIWPSDDARQMDLVERIMIAQNNLGVTLEALTERTGDNSFRARAQGLYTDSARAWDILTRNPQTMIRMLPAPDIYGPSVNPAFMNIRNNLNPEPGFNSHFFRRIDMDMFEISEWETLSPPRPRLSFGVGLAR
ncbi:MAG: tetratricopeptide repeat protein [Treponema sp.]|nr:tetratricopeptide repeat protein [Treponema sp.]